MISFYDMIAAHYAEFNGEVSYSRMADFVAEAFATHYEGRVQDVLDLGCGSGNMTFPLLSRGYGMIGVDASEEMLAEARLQPRGDEVLWLCQDMRSFELYGTVEGVVCTLDGINHLPSASDVKACFSLVHNYLVPDGIFVFDVNTPYKFREVYGHNAYVLEDESPEGGAVYCGWQNEYDAQSGICDFWLSLFEETEEGVYRRSDEHQRERCYSMETLRAHLERNGFEWLGAFADFDFQAPDDTTERWYVAARAKKDIK